MYLTVFSSASTTTSSILTTVALVCFVLAAPIMIFSILFDIKIQRRERAAGKNVLWYKRHALFSSGSGLCFIIGDTFIILMSIKMLSPVPFFYILASLLIVCGFCGAVYSLKLAREQQKTARDHLKSLQDKQKDQSLQ